MIYTPQPLYLAVTNPDWFKFHKNKQSIEVNFWKPSAAAFKTLQPGQNLLFKLKKPYNHVAGGGTFVRYEQTRLSEAWRLYEQMNGYDRFSDFKKTLASSNKHLKADPNADPLIGCIILEACHYYEPNEWIECPKSFNLNIVSGRTYSVDEADGQVLNAQFEQRRSEAFQDRILGLGQEDPFKQVLATWDEARQTPQFGQAYLTKPRLGQGGFRSLVLDAYGKQCAITKEHTEPVLEAAHILPYSMGGHHSLDNALLLRSDFHTLFDRGYITITPDYKFEVSSSLREHYNNGIRYEERRGILIDVPSDIKSRPDPQILQWHNENVFRS